MTGLTLAAALVLAASATANAQTIRLTAVLNGANETPAPGVLTGALGSAEVFVNLQAKTVDYEVKVFNLPTVATAGHFHVGGPGLGGPVVVNITPPAFGGDFVVKGTATAANLTVRADQGIKEWDDFIQALVGGNAYVNIHTGTNPGGEIRGQLTVSSQ
jgi:hypothetical protein